MAPPKPGADFDSIPVPNQPIGPNARDMNATNPEAVFEPDDDALEDFSSDVGPDSSTIDDNLESLSEEDSSDGFAF
jgi:hypothetical protein